MGPLIVGGFTLRARDSADLARMMREGRFHPAFGLGRIVDYHERQDARYASAAAELSVATGKPSVEGVSRARR